MPRQSLDQLKSVLHYDPDTGHFHWKNRNPHHNGHEPGDIAGTPKDGYVQINCGRGRLYRAHRLAWWFMTGRRPRHDKDIEHRDGNRSNNRWANLDMVTRTRNMQNLNNKLQSNNRSGHRGISWLTIDKKWHARISVNKKIISLGSHIKLADAVAARKQAEQRYFNQGKEYRHG